MTDFKVGDEVRIVSIGGNVHHAHVGSVYKIREAEPANSDYDWVLSNGNVAYESELELVNNSVTIETVFVSIRGNIYPEPVPIEHARWMRDQGLDVKAFKEVML